MSDGRQALFDDAFDSFSMIAGSNFVSLYDVRLRVTRFSDSLVDLIGLPSAVLSDGVYDWLDYVHPEDREIYETIMAEMFALRKKNYDITYRIRLADGDYALFRLVGGVIRDEDGHPSLIGGMMIPSGVIERTDRVTSMGNLQAFLDDMMDYELTDANTTVLIVGFGRMTHINEVYGYGHGNTLLIKTAQILKEIVDDRGRIYRTNGSKFVITFFSVDEEKIFEIYDTIQKRFRKGVTTDEGIVHNLFAYGGYMRYEEDAATDRTMYDCLLHAYNESKLYHHGELVIYNGSTADKVGLSGTVALIRKVRESMINDFEGFFLLYQPIFAPGSDKPLGAEVLLRWKSETYGIVSSDEFLSEIEQDYVYERLVNWMVKKAFRDGRDFIKANPDFKLFLTVTQSQLWTPYFVSNLEEIAREYRFPLDAINIHIDKECRMHDVDTIVKFARELNEKKVSFGIDDFARGNMYLKTFGRTDPAYIRFSNELLENILVKENDMTILTYLSNMCAACKTKVYIKGVENKETLDKLAALEIDGVQGALFGEPIYYDEVLDYYDPKDSDN